MIDVFVNYRTADARFGAASAYAELSRHFGDDRVFLDSQMIRPGEVYPDRIRDVLEQARVLVVLIGPEWLCVEPGTVRRLVDRDHDWVRQEIRRALERKIVIIPVLLDGTPMPTPNTLPLDIRDLALRQAVEVTASRLLADMARVIQAAARVVTSPGTNSIAPAVAPPGTTLSLIDIENAMSVLVPRQLPADVSDFVSRETELGDMDQQLTPNVGRPGVVVVSAIAGTAGVGKTTLAVHWAHRVRERFPDGDLYIDLRGYDSQPPVTPHDALSGFLRALGVAPERIPADTHARAAMYRSLLDGKCMLILLDNAANTVQVRPLLPATRTCVVVVTSRSRLSGLAIRNGARLVAIDVLPRAEALLLLSRIAGEERVDRDPDAARRLLEICGQLPLAVRIVGERINANPDTPLADFLIDLEDERARIDALSDLEDDSSAIRSVFSWSYKALRSPAARMFRLLGLHAGPHFTIEAAAALAGLSYAETRRLVDHLTQVHLVIRRAHNRFRFHDLLRAYAAELAVEDEPPDTRDDAVRRGLSWYLHAVDATDRMFAPSRRRVPLGLPQPDLPPPTFISSSTALSWCEAEHANLVAAIRQAGGNRPDVAWQLAAVLGEYLFQRKHWAVMISTHSIGLHAAQRTHSLLGQAWMLTNLGTAHVENEQFSNAADYCTEALKIARTIGDRNIEGHALTNLGIALAGLDRLSEAVQRQQDALAVHRETGNHWGEAWTLTCLGRALVELTRFQEATDCYRSALRLHDLVARLSRLTR